MAPRKLYPPPEQSRMAPRKLYPPPEQSRMAPRKLYPPPEQSWMAPSNQLLSLLMWTTLEDCCYRFVVLLRWQQLTCFPNNPRVNWTSCSALSHAQGMQPLISVEPC
ncbi:hypothetical protein AV530_001676 [Patagioenas fasciata monilis]|uniref:Uncharacterized protein n=1 Tax=Patagioenas fasciata monilis TaxID=372326 RepID=A0A1V4KNT8_PATFA|nr:hypothetical protein AV530_001676 [Patagioenas fasciata monilis]